MLRVRFPAGPHFVQQECAGSVNRAVQIVAEAALFLARWPRQGAQFGFEQRLLAFARAQNDD